MTSGKATIGREKREAPVLLQPLYANRLQCFTPTKPRWDTEDAEKSYDLTLGKKINNADAEKILRLQEKRESRRSSTTALCKSLAVFHTETAMGHRGRRKNDLPRIESCLRLSFLNLQ